MTHDRHGPHGADSAATPGAASLRRIVVIDDELRRDDLAFVALQEVLSTWGAIHAVTVDLRLARTWDWPGIRDRSAWGRTILCEGPAVHLVLLDYRFPDQNRSGVDIFFEIRAGWPHLPIVFFSDGEVPPDEPAGGQGPHLEPRQLELVARAVHAERGRGGMLFKADLQMPAAMEVFNTFLLERRRLNRLRLLFSRPFPSADEPPGRDWGRWEGEFDGASLSGGAISLQLANHLVAALAYADGKTDWSYTNECLEGGGGNAIPAGVSGLGSNNPATERSRINAMFRDRNGGAVLVFIPGGKEGRRTRFVLNAFDEIVIERPGRGGAERDSTITLCRTPDRVDLLDGAAFDIVECVPRRPR